MMLQKLMMDLKDIAQHILMMVRVVKGYRILIVTTNLELIS